MAVWNGTTGDDTYTGTEFDDYINGLLGNDTLYGVGGNDTIVGSYGTDSLYGGGGNDVLEGGRDADFIDGGRGSDTMWCYYAGASVLADLLKGTISGGETTGDTFVSIENLTGSYDYSNELYGDIRINTLIGGVAGDLLVGRGGNDILYGWRGADRMYGGAGNDMLYDDRPDLSAGTEADILNGGAGIDYMAGGQGDDTYYVDETGDTVAEGYNAGNDRIISTATYSMPDNTEILVLKGTGNIDGTGNGDSNTILGNSGNNTLGGGAGNDSLRGSDGADTLNGGLGKDKLFGGADSDVFAFDSVNDSGLGASRDIIKDFVQGEDIIDLSGIDVIPGGDDDGFVDVLPVGDRFTGVAGQLRITQTSADTIISGDVDGDRAADFQIQLSGVWDLNAADFIL